MNHLDLVGWINTARYKWAEIMGREIKFKPATFYLGIADHLARVVEGQGPQPAGEAPEAQGTAGVQAQRREASGERRDREREAMADSLQKGSEATAAVEGPSAQPQERQAGGPSNVGGGKDRGES